MEFTEGFPGSGIRVSPSGVHVAGFLQRDLQHTPTDIVIHSTGNGARTSILNIPDNGGKSVGCGRRELLWSPNGRLIAMVEYGLSLIYVWDMELDSRPVCTIRENPLLGVEKVQWTPDSLHLLVSLRFCVAIRLWRIDERFPHETFSNPKFCDRGITFSVDGRWMAILHRREFEDVITTYDCLSGWRAVGSVRPPETANLDDIKFYPLRERLADFRPALIAWEAAAFSDRMFVFAPERETCKVISGLDEFPCGYERVVWSRIGWIAAAVKNSTTFALWNSITQKMGPHIRVSPASVIQEETVSLIKRGIYLFRSFSKSVQLRRWIHMEI